ncbi:alpha-L-arabinofuranosidase C-terminal domain-containing protein [Nibricoccus sp. IMCC34717]|uniref:alpha-L-arabinofuranosidase C-terminal domain-containing protein n=1 Tax=Nibricoccus sp. IMCC34717 TaxID=3034021 RepID=UPI00384CBD4A
MNRLPLLALLCFALPPSLPAAAPTTLELDPAKTRQPISPLIYGQFIEHLGRCIYGGIWAEMLEDRKFFYPITDTHAPYDTTFAGDFPPLKGSPWEQVGPAGSVTMRTEAPFVGDHTPRVAAGAGMRHGNLEVEAGKAYVGYLWARSVGAGNATVRVALGRGSKAAELAVVPGDYQKLSFRLEATSSGRTELSLSVQGAAVDVGTVSLMPADNVNGMRPDTLALLRELNSPIYRWPGGNFVSGYEWRDGIGDRDRRPPRKNPAWTGIEHNDFGTDEFLAFCRTIGAEALVTVNTGFGDAWSAAQWVEYLNGSSETTGGGMRVRNGHAAPYGVKTFCVGNEMFGTWQLGFMQLSHYVEKHNRVARAMRKADPSIRLIGVGDIATINAKHDPDQAKRGITWSEGMLEASAEYMDLISEHFYEGRLPWTKEESIALEDLSARLKNAIRSKAVAHRQLQARLPNLKGRTVPIAMDEWNYWHRDHTYGEIGCVFDWADGLGVARGLHEFFRNTDIIGMATYAQTVNVIGAIKTTRTVAELETTGVVLALYRAHFGSRPLEAPEELGGVDVSAALNERGDRLTLGFVNIQREPRQLTVALAGSKPGLGKGWLVAAPTPETRNEPGVARQVKAAEVASVDPQQITVPALSVLIVELPLH